MPSRPFHVSAFPDGTPWIEFYRTSEGYLLRFPDLADFIVSADGRGVRCTPVPGTSPATIEHLYLNQVQPLALGKQGKLIFHASAVDIGCGAIAFVAEAGRGKSTLAAAFATNGFRFLTDDGLQLEQGPAGWTAVPSHPSIRLWADSHAHLLPPDADKAGAVAYTSKSRFLAGDALNYCHEPRRLLAAYALAFDGAREISLSRMSPAQSVIVWSKHSFVIDVEDSALISAQFDATAALANVVPFYALDYPRKYEALPGLVRTLARHGASHTEKFP
ncbi:MAG TPA: hypothetical protein PKD49_13060 [Hyphomicrobium sp.]|nr:hypothetical protein [Hyphomicrobium sp.]